MTTSSTPTEYDLALRARDGDRAAVAELTSRTRARLFGLAYAELRHYEDANDALAAGLLQICRHIGNLREPERVIAWMQSIVRNEAHRMQRSRAETLSLSDVDARTEVEDYSLLRLDIERALAEMPVRQAEALRQFYFFDMPIQTIAAESGASEGAVKMWLHRGRQHLRSEMKGYEPMSRKEPVPAPIRLAAVLQSDLEPELRQRIEAALRKAGYKTRFFSPLDLGEPGSTESGPWDVLKAYSALVIVEPFGERSVFEYILLLRASWETADIPVAVVTRSIHPHPDPLSALAYHTLGVAGLASRDAPESLDCLFQWTGGSGMRRDTRTAIILFADDEARRAGQEKIGTEHLLLGLLRDREVTQLLKDGLNLSPEQVAEPIRQRMERLPEYGRHLWRIFTPQADTALQLARDEAGGGLVSTSHLLLGLIREPDGLAGQTLREKGGTPEKLRCPISP
jgi:RNA polymerase sigma-70 factor (ECF subfamily)